jgi:hypothetical protein
MISRPPRMEIQQSMEELFLDNTLPLDLGLQIMVTCSPLTSDYGNCGSSIPSGVKFSLI